ncbi:alkaline phosphatase D family protein [Rheinheimera baltica]|uniref:alkaline phosphatase D family protein n=1 Tax=Rheinheimera baltica TaxID=67576 RepID=UPI00273D6A82|nr:alkaline phosphatase D family protein [Rheinheimera baltica]MDP5143377.1 alkaline phosphatase D family protein [Rheinheimera baltica]
MTRLTRRDFLFASAATIGSVVISTSLTGCSSDEPAPQPLPYNVEFSHGVACGDPTADALLLWTRVTADAAEVPLEWQLALDKEFSQLVRSGETTTSAASDYTVKIDVRDLSAGSEYFYRFRAGTQYSAIGRGKTLPTGDVNQVKLAVFSCANYPAGYFHVYAKATEISNLDATIHLGDYLYEYGVGGYASEDAAALGREVQPVNEMVSLADYRQRYGQYRTDTALQQLHAAAPMIAVWDDHEVTNDTWRDGAENHQPNEGDFTERKRAALQAYFEWMPIRPLSANDEETIYRQFEFGNLVNLLMLDTRVIGRDKQLEYAQYIDPVSGQLDETRFSADLTQSNRTILGNEQLQWLQDKLSQNDARWQILGQQVLMGRMLLPGAVALQQLSITDFAELATLAQLAARAQAGDPSLTAEQLAYLQANQQRLTPQVIALLQLPAMPYNLDAWDGYPAEREAILANVAANQKKLLVLAGDTHNGWANHLDLADGTPVGVELATSSVTSPGLEQYINLPDRASAVATEQALVQLISGLQYANLYDRGFMVLTVSPETVNCQWLYVDTIKQAEHRLLNERQQNAKIDWTDSATRLTLI